MPYSEYGMNIVTAELQLRKRFVLVNGRLPVRLVRMGEIYGNEFEADGDRTYPGLIKESLRQTSTGKPALCLA